MPQIGTLIDFTPLTRARSADVDQNFADIRTAFNDSAVLTDVAKTITVGHTFTVSQTFAGGATFGAGVTVSAGTTAVQALTATTGSFSSTLAISGAVTVGGDASANAILSLNSLANTSRYLRTLSAGARKGLFGMGNDTRWEWWLSTGVAGAEVDTEYMRLSSTQLQTLNSVGLEVAGATSLLSTLGVTGAVSLSSALKFVGSAAASGVPEIRLESNLLQVNAGSSGVRFADTGNTAEWGRMTGGILAWGTTVTTGAASGDAVFAINRGLRGVTTAGTDTIPLIQSNANGSTNFVQIAGNAANAITTVGTTVVTSAAAGDVVLASGRGIRSVNSGGTDTVPLLFANANGTYIANNTTLPIILGAPASVASAAAGDVVLANAKAIRSANAAGTDTYPLIASDANNYVLLGGTGRLVAIGYLSNASLPAGAAAANGGIVVDQTNNRLVYYSGGNRYYLPIGTAF